MTYRYLIVLALGLMAGLSSPSAGPRSQLSAAEIMDILMWGREPVGGPFALTDHYGQPRADTDFRGKLMLVYFGFTYCPDICPTDLQNIGLAIDQLGAAGETLQPLFITVDPERDTASHLADYVKMFHPRLIGLTGDSDAIRKAADAYRVYYARIANEAGTDYTVDHTAFIYLMGVNGEYLGFFPPGTTPDRMTETIRSRLSLLGR